LTALLGCPHLTDYSQTIPFIDNPYNYTPPIDKLFFLGTLCLKGYIFFNYYMHEKNDLRKLQIAFESYEIAWQYADIIRESLEFDESKLLIALDIQEEMTTIMAVTHSLYTVTKDIKYLYAAFSYVEKNKAYLMLQGSQEKVAKQQSAIPSTLLQLESELREKLALLEKKIQSEKQKKEKEDKLLLQQYQNDHFQVYHQFEVLRKQLEDDYPNYYRLKYDTTTVSVEALQNTLTEHQTVLNYFIDEKKIYLFAITSDEYEVFTLDKPNNWTELLQNHLQSIKLHQKREFCQLSFELYQILLQEAMHHIIDPFTEKTEQRELFIIPYEELYYLPFETLIIQEANASESYQELNYLLDHCQISYHYSATLLHLDLQKQVMGEPADTDITFTGFAPIYDVSSNAQKQALKNLQSEQGTAVNRSEAVRSDGTWVPLPYSKVEVEGIAELFEKQGFKSQSFLYESATKNNLEEQISNSRFVLIAAHGIVNNEYPDLSGLILASESGGETAKGGTLLANEGEINRDEERSLEEVAVEDCILNMKEVAMIPMSADLVVLSSCESSIGELHKCEGMMAVNRGFLSSGAKNVISTLFKVNDRASSELTILLFRYILEGDSYKAALQKAKLELLKREGMSPKAWSGFVLFGKGI
ncbi:MAG: CHAT domain-containing protein, partial [Chitinophagales bacterium]